MKFFELHKDKVFGALSGLDRIRFRGTIRWLSNSKGMYAFLCGMGILMKDFKVFAGGVTKEIRGSCVLAAAQLGIPIVYLNNSSVDKEKEARRIASERNVSDAPICMFSVVEPCISPTVVGNRASRKLEIIMKPRKCMWIYYYFDHPEYGLDQQQLGENVQQVRERATLRDHHKQHEGFQGFPPAGQQAGGAAFMAKDA